LPENPIVRLPVRLGVSLSLVLVIPLGACFGSSTNTTPPGQGGSATDPGEKPAGTGPDAPAGEAGAAPDGAAPDAPADVATSSEAGAPTSSTSIASGQIQQPQDL